MKLPDAVMAELNDHTFHERDIPIITRLLLLAFTEGQKSMRERAAKVCDKSAAYYEDGTMCSMAESVHGEGVSKELAATIRSLEVE